MIKTVNHRDIGGDTFEVQCVKGDRIAAVTRENGGFLIETNFNGFREACADLSTAIGVAMMQLIER